MVKRIITGACYVAVVVGMFFLRTIDIRLFNILIYFVSVVGAFEMVRAMGTRITNFHKCVAMAYALSLTPIYTFLGVDACFVLSFVAAVLVVSTFVFQFDLVTIETVGLAVLTLVYPTAMLLPMLLINSLGEFSFIAMLLVFVIAPFSDSFAYIIGSLMGKRKFSPKISPKKTVAGAVGGIIGGVVGTIICYFICARGLISESLLVEILLFTLCGLVGSVFSEFGDLVEGGIKRKLEIKDMGKILPGHGGILDRFDSTIYTSLFIYMFFALIP